MDPGDAPALRMWGAPAQSAAEEEARGRSLERLRADMEAMLTFRPAYAFWQHIFTIPDGRIAFGSALDGTLLATFPERGDWARQASWQDPSLSAALRGHQLPTRLTDRREEVARLLEPIAGPMVHNPTRGQFLLPNVGRYGSFLGEWGAIYERFGVPPEIGLSQAILESGLDGRARSSAQAVGFCQWLIRNWNFLDRLSAAELEAYNQTTQAPYCAAYLAVLATMYDSFIPALSEHHAGGVNVGRTVINGERLGATETRYQYLMGAEFARSLRGISIRRYRDLFRTYGVRSFLYAEMVFGNTFTVRRLIVETPQSPIFAMRATRSIPLSEVVRRTGLSESEVKRYNPALVRQVPAGANLYLPSHVPEFGLDVAFWHRSPDPAYAAVLNQFLRIDATLDRWHEASFESVLRGFQRRFEATNTEEGEVMGVVLAYLIGDLRTSRRAAILQEFRTSGRIMRLFEQGVRELGTFLPIRE